MGYVLMNQRVKATLYPLFCVVIWNDDTKSHFELDKGGTKSYKYMTSVTLSQWKNF